MGSADEAPATEPRLTRLQILSFLRTEVYPTSPLGSWQLSDPLPDDDYSAILNNIGELFARNGLRYYTLSHGDLDVVERTYSGLATAIGILFQKLGGTYVA